MWLNWSMIMFNERNTFSPQLQFIWINFIDKNTSLFVAHISFIYGHLTHSLNFIQHCRLQQIFNPINIAISLL